MSKRTLIAISWSLMLTLLVLLSFQEPISAWLHWQPRKLQAYGVALALLSVGLALRARDLSAPSHSTQASPSSKLSGARLYVVVGVGFVLIWGSEVAKEPLQDWSGLRSGEYQVYVLVLTVLVVIGLSLLLHRREG